MVWSTKVKITTILTPWSLTHNLIHHITETWSFSKLTPRFILRTDSLTITLTLWSLVRTLINHNLRSWHFLGPKLPQVWHLSHNSTENHHIMTMTTFGSTEVKFWPVSTNRVSIHYAVSTNRVSIHYASQALQIYIFDHWQWLLTWFCGGNYSEFWIRYWLWRPRVNDVLGSIGGTMQFGRKYRQQAPCRA